jgi:hypothetical protein
MKIKSLFIAMFLLANGIVKADVQVETSCYVHVPRDGASKHIKLVLRTYVDTDLQKEIGAFVQYNDSKEIIPLVFESYRPLDSDSPNLGNYEIKRLEILRNKTEGEYVISQTGAGNTQGKSVTYKKSTTGKPITFMYLGDDDDPTCKINK